jgi:DNA-directed RNA polymerase specialized sigma subunit
MDGEVFNLSRELLDGLKKTGLYFNIGTDSPYDPCVMWQMNYILKIKMNWSAKKREIVKSYEKNNNQSKVAHEVGLTQQAVSKNLKSSSFNEIELAKKDLKESLNNYPVIKKSKSDDNYSSLNQWLK